MYQTRNKKVRRLGFTLIELLVVIAIIALLASIVLVALGKARSNARNADRRATLLQLSKALELYYNTNGAYPSTGKVLQGVNGTACGGVNGTLTGASGYIPNLAPTYVPILPTDPLGASGCSREYLYDSDGVDYLLMSYLSVENCNPTAQAKDPMHNPDPAFAGECDYAIYTPGASGNNYY